MLHDRVRNIASYFVQLCEHFLVRVLGVRSCFDAHDRTEWKVRTLNQS